MRPGALIRLLAAAAAIAAAGCAEQPVKPSAPSAPPQISEDTLRQRARDQLAQGVKHYEAGEYDAAMKALAQSLDHGLLPKAEQSRARKLLAFMHCVSGRESQCRVEFRKAFEINPDFALTPAEDGHPTWGPVYRSVRNQLISEREAASASERRLSILPMDKAEQALHDAMVKYDAGDYAEAQKLYESALKLGLKGKADQVKALKHLAFTLCLADKWALCRATFARIYEVDPDFDLAPAEAGHPSWTKTFAQAKAQAKKALAEKAAKEKQAKDKAPVPAPAAVPKKN